MQTQAQALPAHLLAILAGSVTLKTVIDTRATRPDRTPVFAAPAAPARKAALELLELPEIESHEFDCVSLNDSAFFCVGVEA